MSLRGSFSLFDNDNTQSLKDKKNLLTQSRGLILQEVSKIDLSDVQAAKSLFGRQMELKALKEAFGKVYSPTNLRLQLCIIHGPSGVGKTAILKHFQIYVNHQQQQNLLSAIITKKIQIQNQNNQNMQDNTLNSKNSQNSSSQPQSAPPAAAAAADAATSVSTPPPPPPPSDDVEVIMQEQQQQHQHLIHNPESLVSPNKVCSVIKEESEEILQTSLRPPSMALPLANSKVPKRKIRWKKFSMLKKDTAAPAPAPPSTTTDDSHDNRYNIHSTVGSRDEDESGYERFIGDEETIMPPPPPPSSSLNDRANPIRRRWKNNNNKNKNNSMYTSTPTLSTTSGRSAMQIPKRSSLPPPPPPPQQKQLPPSSKSPINSKNKASRFPSPMRLLSKHHQQQPFNGPSLPPQMEASPLSSSITANDNNSNSNSNTMVIASSLSTAQTTTTNLTEPQQKTQTIQQKIPVVPIMAYCCFQQSTSSTNMPSTTTTNTTEPYKTIKNAFALIFQQIHSKKSTPYYKQVKANLIQSLGRYQCQSLQSSIPSLDLLFMDDDNDNNDGINNIHEDNSRPDYNIDTGVTEVSTPKQTRKSRRRPSVGLSGSSASFRSHSQPIHSENATLAPPPPPSSTISPEPSTKATKKLSSVAKSYIRKQPAANPTSMVNQLSFIFRQLLKCCSCTSHPIILLLDDLQWADEESLDFISSLFRMENCPHVMVAGAFVDDKSTDGMAKLDGLRLSVQSISDRRLSTAQSRRFSQARFSQRVLVIDSSKPTLLRGTSTLSLSSSFQTPQRSEVVLTPRKRPIFAFRRGFSHRQLTTKPTLQGTRLRRREQNDVASSTSDEATDLVPPIAPSARRVSISGGSTTVGSNRPVRPNSLRSNSNLSLASGGSHGSAGGATLPYIADIEVKTLPVSSINEMMSDILEMPMDKTASLAVLVAKKTHGNMYSVLHFLETLQTEQLLIYSMQHNHWIWDTKKIQAETKVTRNVGELLASRIHALSPKMKSILKLAACCGVTFDETFLVQLAFSEKALSNDYNATTKLAITAAQQQQQQLQQNEGEVGGNDNDNGNFEIYQAQIHQLLQEAAATGLISPIHQNEDIEGIGTNSFSTLPRREERVFNPNGSLQSFSSSKPSVMSAVRFRFSHDLIHQCLYNMLPTAGRGVEALHLRIGRLLRQNLGRTEQPSLSLSVSTTTNNNHDSVSSFGQQLGMDKLFLTTFHLNTGCALIDTDTERMDLVYLNLQASERAKAVSSFRSAMEFLEKAISLIDNDKGSYEFDWQQHYRLVLEVYTCGAEAAHSCGDLHRSLQLAEVVIEHGRSLQETIRAHFIVVEILGLQRKLSEALHEGTTVLIHAGCKFPKRLRKKHVAHNMDKIKKILKYRTAQDMYSMKRMTDEMKEHTLKLLDSVSLIAWLAAKDILVSYLMTLMMLLTLEHGVSIYTPFSLAAYGRLLADSGNTDEAYKYGCMALELAFRLKTRSSLPRTALIVYTFTHHLRNPLLDSVEPLLNGHRIGLEIGDVEYSSMCLCQYSSLYVAVGLPLAPYVEDMRNFCEQLELHNQDQCVALVIPYWQLALNLMGRSKDPLILTGEAMDQEFFLSAEDIPDRDMGVSLINLRFILLFLAYIFDHGDILEERWKQERKQKKGIAGTHFLNYLDILLSGLAAAAIYRQTGKRRYKLELNQCVKLMKILVKRSGLNAHSMYIFLLAEQKSLRGGDVDVCRRLYDDAIASFARSGSIHYEAIACERAGDFMVRMGDSYWSNVYYSRSVERYSEWGALAKVNQLRRSYSIADDDKTPAVGGVSLAFRGRQRYDPSTWDVINKSKFEVHYY